MKKLLGVLLIAGCSTLFNADKYNPNPRPISVKEPKVDTTKLIINGVEIIILDTLKTD
tara:strand:- start:201 stop:374 length:174 start_codon:yes stop_codon:yes gene_type:complete